MNVAFFGLHETFDFHHISGFQSYIRRISAEMIALDVDVDYVLYGSEVANEVEVAPNWKLKYFKSFNDAITHLAIDRYDHVVIVRLSSYRDRIRLALSHSQYAPHAKFHYMYSVRSDYPIMRSLRLVEAKLISRHGRIICSSPRLHRSLSRWAKNVDLLYPPVSRSYFIKPGEKPAKEKINLTFAGVIYPNKGIDEVIEVFSALKEDPKFETVIHAIYEPRNYQSVSVRNWLREQEIVKYVEVDRYNYTPGVEVALMQLLRETDIFIQPYTSLGTTVDTPLLLLEAMASLCAVITTTIGSIPEIYGPSKFLINPNTKSSEVVDFLQGLSVEDIAKERERIFRQNNKLNFEASHVAQRFIEVITK